MICEGHAILAGRVGRGMSVSVHIEKPNTTRDWKAVGDHLGQAAVEAAWANGPGVLASLRSAIGEETLNKQTATQRAYTWIWASLEAALYQIVKDERIAKKLDLGDAASAIEEFEAKVMPPDGTESVTLSTLKNPKLLPTLDRACDAVRDLLHRIAPNADLTDQEARNLLRNAFWDEAGQIFTHETEFYAPITNALTGPAADGRRRELAWSRHAKWIQGLWDHEPIFGQDEESGLSLSKVYERLRCYWHTEHEREDAESDRDAPAEKDLIAHVDELHETLHKWLDVPAGTDRLRLVTGGPGCGKSSFARAFAVEVIERDYHRVIFVSLQRMAFGGDLTSSIGAHLKKRWHATKSYGAEGFQENPFDHSGEDEKPLLLIFDGLDELSPKEEKATEVTRKFVAAVNSMLRSTEDIKAVVLGRPTACQEAMEAVEFELPRETLLHVAPLIPLAEDGEPFGVLDGLQEGEVIKVEAPDGLMLRDQRTGFWQRWATLVGDQAETVPPAITSAQMGELNSEPLLLYLLILSGYAGDKWEEALGNRNVVYQAIFARVFERNKMREDFLTAGIDEPDFFGLMECLGLAAWQGNGRTGTDEEFDQLRDLHMRHRKSALKGVEGASLRGAAVNFYTRRDLGGEGGFEFLHKSFGEYLSARGVINFGRRLVKAMSRDDEPITVEEAAKRWVDLIGEAELSEQVIRFACDEVRLLSENDAVRIVEAKETLTCVFNWSLRHGMPVHQAREGNASYRTLETRQRCAESALLLVLSALARTLPEQKDGSHYARFVFPHSLGLFDMLQRLNVSQGRTARELLSRVDASGFGLEDVDLFRANLYRANLSGSNLFGANLSSANLSEANLISANLYRANLNSSNLSRTHLSGANLVDANLSGSNLTRTDLNSARLNGADLRDAILRKANLKLADCNRVRIDSARLQSANLKGAKNLTQEQIDSAEGNSETVLPEGLVRPEHWED